MPKMRREAASTTPKALRPFLFHGLDLDPAGEQATGDCPFCGREGKFSVHVETGQWRCWVCAEGTEKGGGNVWTFLRLLWEHSDRATNGSLPVLAQEIGLLDSWALSQWGVVKSAFTGEWLVPGYSADGKICQLYKYGRDLKYKRWMLWPTPELHHQIHGIGTFYADRPTLYVCEGWKDGVALWETLRLAKLTDTWVVGQPVTGLQTTASELSSLLMTSNVIAIPTCTAIGDFTPWQSVFAEKTVFLLYDSDHRETNGKVHTAGYDGMRRAAQSLANLREKPNAVYFLKWGDNGYDPALKSGYDVRDRLLTGDSAETRVAALGSLLDLLRPIPADWLSGRSPAAVRAGSVEIEPLECREWKKVVNGWRKALELFQSTLDAFTVMMAVGISTEQAGDQQLFLQVIGDAGSAKTRLCDAMLVSKSCHALEHLTGFHSGMKDGSGDDFSLIARINRKTLITPEGDVLMSSPKFPQIMSEQRRIFDGTSGATYKNMKEDRRYEGLRTPWIMAGTPALLNTDQSRLGDRFLKIIIDRPDEEGVKSILRRVGYNALRAVVQKSNCSPASIVEGRLLEAYRLTGGYLNYLRANSEELITKVNPNEEVSVERCAAMAEFTSYLRAREDDPRKRERHDTREMPTRLTHQFLRLAACLAAVTQRFEIDDEILRIVRKVSIDTANGHSLDIAKLLYPRHDDGLTLAGLALQAHETEERVTTQIRFLRKIGVVEQFVQKIHGASYNKIRLTHKMRRLFKEVMVDA